MIVNKNSLAALYENLKTTFNKAFESAESQWQELAMLVPSTGSQNAYKWFGAIPRMRKWIGAKHLKSLKAFGYTIENDDFEVTLEVDRNDIDDDQLGVYKPQIEMIGQSGKQLPDEIVGELIDGVFVNKCYDGQFMCDTDHEVAGASVSNKSVAVLSCATLAAAKASFGAAKTAMSKQKDEEGRPLGVKPNVLVVPPALEDEANLLMTVDRLEDGKPNPYKGACKVVVYAWLTSDTAWFLLDTSKPVRALIYQERKKPVFVSQTDMNSSKVFFEKKYVYGVEARAAGGYGFWQMIYGSTGLG